MFDNTKPYLENAVVVFDGTGSRQFKRELATYLRLRMNDKKIIRVKKVKMLDSRKTNLIQLADMVCGAINLSLKSTRDEDWEYRLLMGHRELSAKIWPPKMMRKSAGNDEGK